jgi:2-polyprenyl-3-methyl-5-hydroxy-6-metoxy-1,4-benzoquinol methylase
MRSRHPAVQTTDPDTLPSLEPTGVRTRSLVLVDMLEALSDERGGELLGSGWRLVEPGGRLIVAVPNPEAASSDDLPRWSRRKLRRLLRGFGEPRVLTEQPYRWLVMCVLKPGRQEERPKPSRRRRYGVTARLCRGRVIELGCGEGHLAGMIADRGHEVVGVDISRDKIALARRLYPAIEFFDQDIAQVGLADGSFDTAVLAEVLEHVHEDTGQVFLANAWRLLRPGGRLIVSVPNEDCIPHRNHVREFDRRSLRDLLRPLGSPRLVADQPYKWLLMHVDKT